MTQRVRIAASELIGFASQNQAALFFSQNPNVP
jgi:hypothetical protein